MNSLDYTRHHTGLAAFGRPEFDAAGLVSAGMYATPPKWRLIALAAAVCFGAGIVFGIMLGQGSPTYAPSPNVCRADEVSRIDCVHVVPTTAAAVPGVAR
ncbi:hypothetical protein [Nocardia nova]|uniref:hypothetical protein n=1 Tax=Nocardia nova TaxID=37330 RepID=UPI0011AFEDD2|nr:hypothetical protein [Nocardia nova]